MSYLMTNITRTDTNGVETTINDWEKITVKKGMDQKANIVDITMTNAMSRTPLGETDSFHKWVGDDGELTWQEEDVITVQAAYTNAEYTLLDEDTLTIADALEFNVKLESSRTPITIKAADKTFALLNQNWAQAFTITDAKTAPQIIQSVIRSVSENDSGDGTFQIDATLQAESTYALQRDSATPGIQTRRINNSLFPIVPMAKVYKPAYEWIDDLSALESTNNFDGRDTGLSTDSEETPTQNMKMRYFVDKDNKFRWFYPDNIVDYTIAIGTVSADQDDVKNYALKKSTFDIVNFVIYNGGKDLYGVGTLNYFFDENTKSKKLLSKYKAYTELADIAIQKEINSGNLVSATSGAFTFQGNRYDRSGTVTPFWGNTAYSTDDTYNDSLRAFIDSECKKAARDFTAGRGSPRWSGNITIKGRNFLAGEVIQLTSKVHGINGEKVRILDLTHTITKDAWMTTVKVEEDDDPIGTNLS
jgi:hypothetical protein